MRRMRGEAISLIVMGFGGGFLRGVQGGGETRLLESRGGEEDMAAHRRREEESP